MKKKILALALAVCLLAVAIVGGTMAYLTDTDGQENTFTSGNVEIVQNEKDREGNDFEQGQKLFPIVNDGKDNDGYHTGKNYIDKIVTVTNTGSEAAYIRTFIAIPAALDNGPEEFDASKNILHWNGASANDTFAAANKPVDNDWYWGVNFDYDWPGDNQKTMENAGWNFYTTEKIDGVQYHVYVATHKATVAPKATTAPTLLGIYLDKNVDYNNETDKYSINGVDIDFDLKDVNVYVVSQAVQADGFSDAFTALNEAFGTPGTEGFECPIKEYVESLSTTNP